MLDELRRKQSEKAHLRNYSVNELTILVLMGIIKNKGSWDCTKIEYKYERIEKVKSIEKRSKHMKRLAQHVRNLGKLK